jgi:ribosomal protein S18 acetylase RimI-like enzyme
MKTATRYLVRRMLLDDIPQVLEVERESFPTMWPPTAFKRELQQNHLAHYTVVVEHDPSRLDVEAPVPEEEPGLQVWPHLGRIIISWQRHACRRFRLPSSAWTSSSVSGVWMLPTKRTLDRSCP